MRIKNALRFLVFGWLALVWSGEKAHAQSNLVLLISSAGDYIGSGATYYTTNQADFNLSGSASTVRVIAFGFFINIDAPGDSNLVVGEYTNAVPYPFNENLPGLAVAGNGRSCLNNACGNFRILELQTNASGEVIRFWATFSHRCQCELPLTGEIRYNSLLAPPTPLPRTLRVPAEFPTIQSAITNAQLLAMDTVLVDPGVYREAVVIGARPVQVISSKGPSATYIISPDTAAVTFSGSLSNAVLSGFTLMDSAYGIGAASEGTVISNAIVNCGIGINCGSGSSIVIQRNSIVGSAGGAIQLAFTSRPIIDGNLIEDNGGGIGMSEAGAPIIRNNVIRRNRADGIGMGNDSNADIVQNVIAENAGNGISWLVPTGARGPWVVNNTIAGNGGAGIRAEGYDSGAIIVNNIVVGNPALWAGGGIVERIQFNNFFSLTGVPYGGSTNLTGVAGNISSDPLFACQPSGDYHLLAGSYSIDMREQTGLHFCRPLMPMVISASVWEGQINNPSWTWALLSSILQHRRPGVCFSTARRTKL